MVELRKSPLESVLGQSRVEQRDARAEALRVPGPGRAGAAAHNRSTGKKKEGTGTSTASRSPDSYTAVRLLHVQTVRSTRGPARPSWRRREGGLLGAAG